MQNFLRNVKNHAAGALALSCTIICTLASALAFTLACTRASAPTSAPGAGYQLTPKFDSVFSVRPQSDTHAFLLIKLQTPPLLATVVDKDGRKTLDPAQVAALTAEQDLLLQKLSVLSSDIKVVYRYRLVINALAIVTPIELVDQIRAFEGVAYAERSGLFARSDEGAAGAAAIEDWAAHNSAKFIGATAAHDAGFRGQKMRVGVIDTGIDYTHVMFGGAGTPEAYKAVDPKLPNAGFPSAKVIGGTDLVGTDFDSGSPDFLKRLPAPDANPIDEAGHGSHVAGTIAGHGDGIVSYDGVAPDASLYAIKVFGKEGSTGDATVIAGLEYAANPKGDADITDHLDVVNLSLGSDYGDPHILYSEAIRNLTRGGTVVVTSAGNSGDTPYVVGSPSIADNAISVAASIDDMDHNWRFRAVQFTFPDQAVIFAEALAGTAGKSLDTIGDVQGTLIPAGLADKDYDDAAKALLKGKVALIDRGIATFADKIHRAEAAQAIGVVVVNNQPGDAVGMPGEGDYQIPAMMVSQELGKQLKAQMLKGDVRVAFKTDHKIEKPQLIDSIATFSSRGPRSVDGGLKPEITAPGVNIVSVDMGTGAKTVQLSGTSMASPHIAGSMTLIKQAHPNLSVNELKSLAMETSKILPLAGTPANYPIARQGAGRVQIAAAIQAPIVMEPAGIALGEIGVVAQKVVHREITIKNITGSPVIFTPRFVGQPGLQLDASTSLAPVMLAPNEAHRIDLRFAINAKAVKDDSSEIDGWLQFVVNGQEVAHAPVLGVINKISEVHTQALSVRSTSDADSDGAVADLVVENPGQNAGNAYPFNFLATNSRKISTVTDDTRSTVCALSGLGYRILRRDGQNIVQFAVKLYQPLTTWDQCEISILIDGTGTGIADQELAGIKINHLPGLTGDTFNSVLIDSRRARDMRKAYEVSSQGPPVTPIVKEDYSSTVVSTSAMLAPLNSSIAIVEAPIEKLKTLTTGELRFQVVTSYQEGSAIEPDDYLGHDAKTWVQLSLLPNSQSYVDLPEVIAVNPRQVSTSTFARGATGGGALWMLYPSNTPSRDGFSTDRQAELVSPIFVVNP